MIVQFDGFYREYLTEYPKRAAFWFDGNHPGAFEPLVRQHGPDDRRFIYLSRDLPRVQDHWKLYLLSHRRTDLLKRTVYFTQQDIQLAFVRPGSLLLTGVDDPVERSFQKMEAVRVADQIKEPDGSASFTIFERTQWNALYRFDGTYTVQSSVVCARRGMRDTCAELATTASCPSMETITVTNSLAIDSCGYLKQAAVAEDGRYVGSVTNYGISVNGTFTPTGTFALSGSGVSGGTHYDFTFVLTKRN